MGKFCKHIARTLLVLLILMISFVSFTSVSSLTTSKYDMRNAHLSESNPPDPLATSFPSAPRANSDLFAQKFDAGRVYTYVEYQVNLGYRVPGTQAHDTCAQWISATMDQFGSVIEFPYQVKGINCTNILGKVNTANDGQARKILIMAAHYDTRAVAEKDPDPSNRNSPIPGANDGASGVAVLLELARTLSILSQEHSLEYEYWFMFIDAEDQGVSQGVAGIEGWDWCEGSKWWADEMQLNPSRFFTSGQSLEDIEGFILLDMVGGIGLKFALVSPYDKTLYQNIFTTGRNLGYYDAFPEGLAPVSVEDDHVYFSELGIPSFDLIIPFWDNSQQWSFHHTQQDNLEHISPQSLNITGRTILATIQNFYSSTDIMNSAGTQSGTTSAMNTGNENNGIKELWEDNFAFRYSVIVLSSTIGIIILLKIGYSFKLKKQLRTSTLGSATTDTIDKIL